MIGGMIAGAGALISGGMIASSNRDIARAQLSHLEDFNNNANIGRVAGAFNDLNENINELTSTFNDEFNDRQKRLVQMYLSDEDDEPIKFSEYFNQVPLFKENLKTAFYSETKKEYEKSVGSLHNEEIYATIQSISNIKEALKILGDLAHFMPWEILPKRIYDDFFKDDTVYCDCFSKQKILHKGFSVIYTRFCDDFVARIKDFYKKEAEKAETQIAIYKGQGNKAAYINLKQDLGEYKYIVNVWDPLNNPSTKEQAMKYFKKIDDLVDQTREYAKEMFMCRQERELRKTVRAYLKPDISFELSKLDYDGKSVAFTLKKDDREAYLIIKAAPNVHVTDKEGF